MLVELRQVNDQDIEKIRRWRNSDLIMNVSFNKNYITSKQQSEWFDSIKLFKDQLHWLIIVDGLDAGYAAIKNIDLTNSRCEFSSLYIGEPELLFTGAGALAEFKVINYIYSNFPSINKIFCEVLGFNKKVIQLHKRFGFVVEGELKEHYYINNGFESVILLALFKDNWMHYKESIRKILKL